MVLSEGGCQVKIGIIGAGPAGLAAARELVQANCEIVIFDSNAQSGGQYWRHQKNTEFPEKKFSDISRDSRIQWHFHASVWQIENLDPGFRIHYSGEGSSSSIEVEKILIATGASERTLPFKNWTSPGVMTAGAAQTMAKEHRLLPGSSILIAGSGVFAMPVAKSLITLAGDNGITIELGIIEARSLIRWWRNIPGFILNPGKVIEALGYLAFAKRNRIKRISRSVVTEAVVKDGQLSGVRVARLNREMKIVGDSYLMPCDALATSFGFTPDMTIPSIMGVHRVFRNSDAVVDVDDNQRTSVIDVWAAGEVTGIGGHELSITEGRIAALNIAGVRSGVKLALTRWKRLRQRIFADGLSRIYPIDSKWITWQEDSVVVCRCEEVTLKEIVDSVNHLGADSARSAKLFTRAGMGLCQGRFCQRNVQDITERCTKFSGVDGLEERTSVKDANRETVRPIGGVVTLGELSD